MFYSTKLLENFIPTKQKGRKSPKLGKNYPNYAKFSDSLIHFFALSLHRKKTRNLVAQMLPTSSIRKLTDYILLNACSVNSSGLYNGKAGMALALFEVGNYLQDEYIYDQAFSLFGEASVTKNEDVGFENGLAGVGFMLLYLIESGFVDADFEELFGENRVKIETGLTATDNIQTNEQLALYIRVVYYLCMANKKVTGVKTKLLAKSILKEADKMMVNRLLTLEAGTTSVAHSKVDILNSLELYLKVADFCSFYQPSVELLEKYVTLYRQSKFVSNFAIGCYLANIAERTGNTRVEAVGIENRTNAIRTIYREMLPLAQRIDLLWLLHQNESLYKSEIAYLEENFIDIANEDKLEKILLQSIHPADFIAGYQSGVARFLLYWVYRNTDKEHRQCFHFL